MTTARDVDWLVRNLPANTMLPVDEAYIHFGETPNWKAPSLTSGRKKK